MDPDSNLELSNFAIMPSNCFLIMSLFNANVPLSARFRFISIFVVMSHEINTRFNIYVWSILMISIHFRHMFSSNAEKKCNNIQIISPK